ncbi:MAG: hypothetical protein HY811_06455 [Planctomycetes bacterium]|nr:hypothetical protein [Planctomycetota bacterium]
MKRLYIPALILITIAIFGIKPVQAADALSEAQSGFNSALQYNDVEKIRAAVKNIAGVNNDKAMKLLISQLSRISADTQFQAYWEVVKGFPLFTDVSAFEELADYIITNKTRPVSRDITAVLKDNNSDGLVKLFKKLLEKGNGALREQAVINLGLTKNKNAIALLVEFLQSKDCQKDQDLTKKTIESLHALAGNSIGWTAENIQKWWEKHMNDNEDALFVKPEVTGEGTGTALDFKTVAVQAGIRRIPKDKIIVINSDCPGCERIGKTMEKGWDHNYDHIQSILERMKIPHTVVKKSEFDTEAYKIDDKWVVIMNCNHIREHCVCPTCQASDQKGGLRSVTCAGCDKHTPFANMLSQKGVEKIRNFVANGGYFFSEDWVLEEVVERAWKGVVGHTKYYPAEKNVGIFPAPGQTTHPYLKDVFDKPKPAAGSNDNPADDGSGTIAVKRTSIGENKWKIDADAPDLKVLRANEVVILIVSEDLKTDDPKSGAVAITFAAGPGGQPIAPSASTGGNDGYVVGKKTGGQVMHVLSHFGKQKDASDEYALQNLILNFIMEAVERLNVRKK